MGTTTTATATTTTIKKNGMKKFSVNVNGGSSVPVLSLLNQGNVHVHHGTVDSHNDLLARSADGANSGGGGNELGRGVGQKLGVSGGNVEKSSSEKSNEIQQQPPPPPPTRRRRSKPVNNNNLIICYPPEEMDVTKISRLFQIALNTKPLIRTCRYPFHETRSSRVFVTEVVNTGDHDSDIFGIGIDVRKDDNDTAKATTKRDSKNHEFDDDDKDEDEDEEDSDELEHLRDLYAQYTDVKVEEEIVETTTATSSPAGVGGGVVGVVAGFPGDRDIVGLEDKEQQEVFGPLTVGLKGDDIKPTTTTHSNRLDRFQLESERKSKGIDTTSESTTPITSKRRSLSDEGDLHHQKVGLDTSALTTTPALVTTTIITGDDLTSSPSSSSFASSLSSSSSSSSPSSSASPSPIALRGPKFSRPGSKSHHSIGKKQINRQQAQGTNSDGEIIALVAEEWSLHPRKKVKRKVDTLTVGGSESVLTTTSSSGSVSVLEVLHGSRTGFSDSDNNGFDSKTSVSVAESSLQTLVTTASSTSAISTEKMISHLNSQSYVKSEEEAFDTDLNDHHGLGHAAKAAEPSSLISLPSLQSVGLLDGGNGNDGIGLHRLQQHQKGGFNQDQSEGEFRWSGHRLEKEVGGLHKS
ncbi:hypothetical protein HDU76_005637 [Blyttiomyces sp. JEL0837]|nr:hypothetical protein HDU76_005637 [Blyttiomyces sp. JEL0837]